MKYIKKIKPFFMDDRGEMSYLVDAVKVNSALLITSRKGSVRANHYHKKDSHYSYMVSGKMRYSYKDLNAKYPKKKSIIVKGGEMIYTPPMMIHSMEFLEDSVFIALATEVRNRNKYEDDTVRINLV